jgi:hypothetical protein
MVALDSRKHCATMLWAVMAALAAGVASESLVVLRHTSLAQWQDRFGALAQSSLCSMLFGSTRQTACPKRACHEPVAKEWEWPEEMSKLEWLDITFKAPDSCVLDAIVHFAEGYRRLSGRNVTVLKCGPAAPTNIAAWTFQGSTGRTNRSEVRSQKSEVSEYGRLIL